MLLARAFVSLFVLMIAIGCAARPTGEVGGAASPLVLTEQSEIFNLGLHFDILEDETGQLTIDDVTGPVYAARFRPTTTENPNFGFTPAAIWLRIPVVTQSTQHTYWYLASQRDTVDLGLLYQPQPDGSYRESRAGTDVPFSEWETDLLGWLGLNFKTLFESGEEKVFYLRLSSEGRVNARLAFMSETGAREAESRSQTLIVFITGIFLILLVYNLLLGVWQRDKDMLLLAVFIAATLLRTVVGTFDRVFWPESAGLYDILSPVTIALYAIAYLIFADRVLDLRERMPRVHRWLVGLALLFGLTLLAALPGGRRLVTVIQFIVAPLGFLLILAVSFALARRGDRNARLYFWASLPASILILYDLIPSFRFPIDHAVGEMMSSPGMAISVFLFSVVLAERVADSRQKAEEAGRQFDEARARYATVLDSLAEGVARFSPDGKIQYVNHAFAEFNGNVPEAFIGRNLFEVMKPQSVNAVKAALPTLTREKPISTIRGPAINHLGEERWRLWVFRAFYGDDGQVREYQGTGLDITEEHRLDEELHRYREGLEKLVEQRTAELAASNSRLQSLNLELQEQTRITNSLQQIAYVLNSSLDTEAVLHSILAEMLRFRSHDAAVRILFREGNQLVVVASAGDDHEPQREVFFSLNDRRWPGARAFHTREPVLVEDLLQMEHWPGQLAFPSWRSVVALPLSVREESFGVMVISNTSPRAFSSTDVGVLKAFAEHAALAIANARLYETSKTLAAANERDRLARDLHDSVTQTLFSASLLAEALPVQLLNEPAVAEAGARKLNTLARGALGEMRMLLLELRPATLLATDLETLLTNLVNAAAARSGSDITFSRQGEPVRMPADVRIAFYRIAQEALNNVVKHANASCAEVSLVNDDQEVRLIVSDDGRGYAPEVASQRGMGQSIMYERAMSISATIEMTSSVGHGTTIMLVWRKK